MYYSKKIFLTISLILSLAIAYVAHGALGIPGTCPPGFVPGPFGCEPAPPPPPPEPDPVIILHGIGGSWNPDLFWSEIETDNWDFPPMVHNYDNLLQAFQNEGFILGEDLFLGFYDWRQGNELSATEYLLPIINEALLATGANKVDIVAHSMGGLVARSYIQGSSYRDDVDQLVMLGTPNSGSSDSYLLWEGGELPLDWEFKQRLPVNLYIAYLQLQYLPPISRLEAINTRITSVKELLPVYNFLIDKDSGNPIGYHFMNEVNTFLDDLNNNIGTLLSRVDVTNISGSNVGTINQITVETPDPDASKWTDGQPDPNPPAKDSTEGDNRVLLTSSQITGATQIVLDSGEHGDLPTLA